MSERITDAEVLDALAKYLRETPEWDGGDFCELAVDLLRKTGRTATAGEAESKLVPAYHGPEDPRIAERATVVKLQTVAADAIRLRRARETEGNLAQAAYWRGYEEGLQRAILTVEGRDHSPS